MKIMFYYAETIKQTAFTRTPDNNQLMIYVGRNETRTKEQLLESLYINGWC